MRGLWMLHTPVVSSRHSELHIGGMGAGQAWMLT